MGKTCVFFGHRDCPETIRPALRQLVVELIEEWEVDRFYLGRQGNFDRLARAVLRDVSAEYPHLCYAVVLERLPDQREKGEDTMLPEGMEMVPPRYAISRRNDWMLRQADYVVAYLTHPWGGAAQFVRKALRQQKVVFSVGDSAVLRGLRPAECQTGREED